MLMMSQFHFRAPFHIRFPFASAWLFVVLLKKETKQIIKRIKSRYIEMRMRMTMPLGEMIGLRPLNLKAK
jgi:hypothetical protein